MGIIGVVFSFLIVIGIVKWARRRALDSELRSFLIDLRSSNINQNWKNGDGRLRITIEGREFCPITWLCFKKKKIHYGLNDYISAACVLGLSASSTIKIVRAADNSEPNKNKNIRRELRHALGIPKEKILE